MPGNKTSWSAAFSGVCDNSAEAADAFEKLFEEFVQRAKSLPGADLEIDGNSNGQFYGSGFANAERHVHERDVKPAPAKPAKPGA